MKVITYKELFGKDLTIRDLVEGFKEDTKTGKVTAFNNQLNVRPPYQREFVYDKEKRDAVIDTVLKGYPLNVMYWAKTENGFELMDGQQRSVSICKFAKGQYTIKFDYAGDSKTAGIDDLDDKSDDFYNYPISVYICEGSKEEILAWFKVINIAGLKLTVQEMRNAMYNGSWVTNAKKYFSTEKGCIKDEGRISNGHVYGDYLNVTSSSEREDSVQRQKLLEIVLEWIVLKDNPNLKAKELSDAVEQYMSLNRNQPLATDLIRYFEDVMEWAKRTFPTYRTIMKKVPWGILYNKYKDVDATGLDEKVNRLLSDEFDDISNEVAIYEAVLSGNYNLLNARSFSDTDKKRKYAEQNHRCNYCGKECKDIKDMQGDHIIPWTKGGKTTYNNLQMLCIKCNQAKKAKDEAYNPFDSVNYDETIIKKEIQEMSK